MEETKLHDEINRRRTFAIISHPDAGKTTLTEKLLLYGGAIRQAGSVKSRKTRTYAVSDRKEIEKQRGISVTSSVLNFDYNGYHINILDTPGHQDFSEDTYRTLVAADSAVMLLDGAKGVEAQTKKLFHVCSKRGIPIFTFVNKLDRVCKNPFDLMDELEQTLGIRSYPITWPVGIDGVFKGVYNRALKRLELFENDGGHGIKVTVSQVMELSDPDLKTLIGNEAYNSLCDDIALLDEAGEEYDITKILSGKITPVFFGSAMSNFGVQQFLEDFIEMAPAPSDRNTSLGALAPDDNEFAGFVFKIQANMDPKHRDRLAFVRICSGQYEKGMQVYNVRLKKNIRLAQPQQFLAQDRAVVEEAYAGDIVGLFDSGEFHIGDTLCSEKKPFQFEPIPMFPAEHFAYVSAMDAGKRKQFVKGINQLQTEGAIQVFRNSEYAGERCIVGVAGALQLEVLSYRMLGEYNAEIRIEPLSYQHARWVVPEDAKPVLPVLDGDILRAVDRFDRPVILFKNDWVLQRIVDKNPNIEFADIAPMENGSIGD